MSNAISAGIKETWAKRYQVNHYKIPVYPAISNFEAAPDLVKGDTYHRTAADELVANDMGAEGSFTRQDINDSDETLIINKEKESSFYIKSLDELQNHLSVRDKRANSASAAIFNQIDADVLGEYSSFSSQITAADFGGSALEGTTATVSNVTKFFTIAKKKLQRYNILLDEVAQFRGFAKEDKKARYGVAVISPDFYQTLLDKVEGKESVFGDKVAASGHAGRYMGFDLFISNATGWSGRLEFGTNPSDGDTVVVNGVTLTFRTTQGAAEGSINICSDAAHSLTNLVAFINAGGATTVAEATDAGYNALSAANKKLLKNIAATDGTTYMTLKAKGKGYVAVSETLTAPADIWTTTKQVQHLLFGVNNAIDVVVQKTPSMKIKDRDGYVGEDFVTWSAYGIKVFAEAVRMMVDVWIRTDGFV